jgi:hypothetical protein
MKSSLSRLIPFLLFLCQLPTAKIPSVLFPLLPSSHPGRPAYRNSTNSNDLLCLFITPRHGPRRKHSLSIVEKSCLQRRCITTGSYSIVAYVFVAVGMFLLSSCIPMDVFSDFNIPAFGCHVTLLLHVEVYRIQDLFPQLHNIPRFEENFKYSSCS